MERNGEVLQTARRISDVAQAVSRLAPGTGWAGIPALDVNPAILADNRIITLSQLNPACAPFDMLRTKLLQAMRAKGWTTVGITSPTAACGKSVVATNLAFSLSRQKELRTVLLDLDLRRPELANLLAQKGAPSMEEFLRGRKSVEEAFVRCGDNLAIGTNGRPVQSSSELLQQPSARAALLGLRKRLEPHVVIYDLPPMLVCDDVIAFMPNVDCAILVAGAETTTIREVDICEHSLAEQTKVAGVVLNKCRYTPDKYGY
ncbi:MAG TPA: CpsD/CapB family tyrosine-protein kinase [Rhizobiaceae bacterium]